MKVFISYTREDNEHNDWVENLATSLRRDGIEITLDQWDVDLGDEFSKFMEEGVRDHERVLVICTPKYKHKADKRLDSAGFETSQMTNEIIFGNVRGKFIPVLRKKKWKDALPSYLQGIRGVDLRAGDKERYKQQYWVLLENLSGRRKKAPPVGVPVSETRFDNFKLSFLQDRLMGRAWKVGPNDLCYKNGLLMNQERVRSIATELIENTSLTGTKFMITCIEGEEFDCAIQENTWRNGDKVYTYSEAERWEVLNRFARSLEFRLYRMLGPGHIKCKVTENGDICCRYIE